MEQSQFLEKNIFTDLKTLNDRFAEEGVQYFSESDFGIVLDRAEHFGLSIYSIAPWSKDETHMKIIKRKQLTLNGTRKNL